MRLSLSCSLQGNSAALLKSSRPSPSCREAGPVRYSSSGRNGDNSEFRGRAARDTEQPSRPPRDSSRREGQGKVQWSDDWGPSPSAPETRGPRMARTIPRDPPSVPPPPAPPKAPLTPPPVVRANDNDKGSFYHGSSFKQIGATAEVIAALQTLGITKPSHVQAESYRLLNTNSERGHVAITDQAGSGKTLAYLLPLMQQLRLEEQRALKASGPADSSSESLQSEASKSPSHPLSASLARKRSARLIVLAPTTELAQQVYRVVKALSAAGLKCRSALMTGGEEDPRKRSKSFRTQAEQLEGGLDLLVSTPGRLLAHLDANNISLRDGCNAVVLDEVDVLLGVSQPLVGMALNPLLILIIPPIP